MLFTYFTILAPLDFSNRQFRIEHLFGEHKGDEGSYMHKGELLGLWNFKTLEAVNEGQKPNMIDNWADTSLHLLLLKSSMPRLSLQNSNGALFMDIWCIGYWKLFEQINVLRFSTLGTRAPSACPNPESPSTRYLPPLLSLNRFDKFTFCFLLYDYINQSNRLESFCCLIFLCRNSLFVAQDNYARNGQKDLIAPF